jgi:hypothetical protein
MRDKIYNESLTVRKWWWMKSNRVGPAITAPVVSVVQFEKPSFAMHPANFIVQSHLEMICGYVAIFTMISKSPDLNAFFQETLKTQKERLEACVTAENYSKVLEDRQTNLEFIHTNLITLDRHGLTLFEKLTEITGGTGEYKSSIKSVEDQISELAICIDKLKADPILFDESLQKAIADHEIFTIHMQPLLNMSFNVETITADDFSKMPSIHFDIHRLLDQLQSLHPESLQWLPYGASSTALYMYAIHLFVAAGMNADAISVVYTHKKEKRLDDEFVGSVILQTHNPSAKHLYAHFLNERLIHTPKHIVPFSMTKLQNPFNATIINRHVKLCGFVVASSGNPCHAISGFENNNTQFLSNGHTDMDTIVFPCPVNKLGWGNFCNGKPYYIVLGKCGIITTPTEPDNSIMFKYPFGGFFGMGIIEQSGVIEKSDSHGPISAANDPIQQRLTPGDLNKYISNFNEHIIEELRIIMDSMTEVRAKLDNMLTVLQPSLTSLHVQPNKYMYIDESMRSMRSCIHIIVMNLLYLACEIALDKKPDIRATIEQTRIMALNALNNAYGGYIIDDIIRVAATKYEYACSYFKPTLGSDHQETDSLRRPHTIDIIVDTIFKASKQIYLPADIANGYVKYHRHMKGNHDVTQWIQGKVVSTDVDIILHTTRVVKKVGRML